MNFKKKRIFQIVTAVVSCAFILYGTLRGEILIVLDKAIRVCFECIGLG